MEDEMKLMEEGRNETHGRGKRRNSWKREGNKLIEEGRKEAHGRGKERNS
jgi:hypothetical protein